jgi:glycerol-3-phosphate dehydrogenase
MAAEVVDTVVKLLRLQNHLPRDLVAARTDEEPLPGAIGWPADDDHAKVAAQVSDACEGRLLPDTCRHLADQYGMRGIDIARVVVQDRSAAERLVPDRPEIVAEIDFAVGRELAATISDVMTRRTQLHFRDRDQGLGAIDVVAERIARRLGWDAARTEIEKERYRSDVRRSRRWRAGP